MTERCNNEWMEIVEKKTLEWAEERGIFDKSDPKSQMLKTVEEVGELCETVLKQDLDGFELECGDVMVTLALQCRMQGTDLTTCFNRAFNKISLRKGEMRNGAFVRECG